MTTESQAPENAPAEEEEYQKPEENAMRAARVRGAYLIIAHYNLNKELAVNAAGKHEEARDAARELFPHIKTRGLQHLPGIRMLHTFHSPFFDRLPDDFFSQEDKEQQELTQSAIANLKQEAARAASASTGNGEQSSEGSSKQDALGIGWIAIVDAHYYQTFIKRLGGEDGPFWRVFDTTVIELNDDRTTNDIYQLMTPRSWS